MDVRTVVSLCGQLTRDLLAIAKFLVEDSSVPMALTYRCSAVKNVEKEFTPTRPGCSGRAELGGWWQQMRGLKPLNPHQFLIWVHVPSSLVSSSALKSLTIFLLLCIPLMIFYMMGLITFLWEEMSCIHTNRPISNSYYMHKIPTAKYEVEVTINPLWTPYTDSSGSRSLPTSLRRRHTGVRLLPTVCVTGAAEHHH